MDGNDELSKLSCGKFIDPSPPPLIRGREPLAELIYPEAREFLALAGINSKAAELLAPLVPGAGREGIFLSSALAEVLGISPHRIVTYFQNTFRGRAALNDLNWFKRNCFEISISDGCAGRALHHPDNGDERIKVFPATFTAFPYKYAGQRNGITKDAQIFAMYLEPQRMREIELQMLDGEEDHVENAFAYIRYYQIKDVFSVAEIQSDYFGRLESRSLRERYKHWSKLLLLAFEYYVKSRYDLQEMIVLPPHEIKIRPVIYFPDSEYQLKRWPDRRIPIVVSMVGDNNEVTETEELAGELIPGIAKPLAERLYEALPRSLDYHKITAEADFIPAEKNHSGNSVASAKVWEKNLSDASSAPGRGYIDQFGRLVREMPEQSSAERSLKRHSELFAPEFFRQAAEEGMPVQFPISPRLLVAGADLGSSIAGKFEWAPQLQAPIASIYGARPALISTYRSLLMQKEIQDVIGALSPDFTFISGGEHSGVRSDWWSRPANRSTEWQVTPFHIEGQDRHPSLRFTRRAPGAAPDDIVCVCIKGGGLRSPDHAPVTRHEENAGYAAPFLPHGPRTIHSPQMESQKFWGGMPKYQGCLEIVNTLAVQWMMCEIDAAHEPALPAPLDLGALLAIPVWQDGTLHKWLGLDEYLAQFFKYEKDVDLHQKFATYRSISRSDVRLTQILNRMFCANDGTQGASVFEAQERINQALQYTYWVHGKELSLPEAELRISDGKVGWPEFLGYLREVHQANGQASEEILQEMQLKSLRLMAAVHGSGGHLGGAFSGEIGAVSGGAVTLRNIDAFGVVHDLDMEIFLPWIPRMDGTMERQAMQRKHLGEMKYCDIKYWENSAYWMDIILRGAELAQGYSLHENRFGKYDQVSRFGPHERDSTLAREAEHSAESLKSDLPLLLGGNQAFVDCYRDYFARGAKFAKDAALF